MPKFKVKDSGRRLKFKGGMQRDTADNKTDFTLTILDGPMFLRWNLHLREGAKKYNKHNWMKGKDKEAFDRFTESAVRHFIQWLFGDRTEDHAAACFFNINGVENLRMLYGDKFDNKNLIKLFKATFEE